jgi:hypothetical protein
MKLIVCISLVPNFFSVIFHPEAGKFHGDVDGSDSMNNESEMI